MHKIDAALPTVAQVLGKWHHTISIVHPKYPTGIVGYSSLLILLAQYSVMEFYGWQCCILFIVIVSRHDHWLYRALLSEYYSFRQYNSPPPPLPPIYTHTALITFKVHIGYIWYTICPYSSGLLHWYIGSHDDHNKAQTVHIILGMHCSPNWRAIQWLTRFSWPKQSFKRQFCQCKNELILIFFFFFMKSVPCGFHWWDVIIGLYNGLAPNSQEAII